MSPIRRTAWTAILFLIALGAIPWLTPGGLKAQSTGDPILPISISTARTLALLKAADEKLDYVPGEVLVKFRLGVSAIGQQRALMALRDRPSINELRWI